MKPMSRAKRKRMVLFWTGADAFRNTCPNNPYCYVCPLCLKGYLPNALGELTLDHVPPRSMGGRSLLVLTCKGCNSATGAKLERHMLGREQMLDFAAGTMRRPSRAQIKIGEEAVNVEVLAQGDSVELVDVPKANNPAAVQSMLDLMNKTVADGSWPAQEIKIEFLGGFKNREALLALLKAAYLVAFAIFGYSYILRPEVKRIRQELTRRSAEIRVFSMTIEGATKDERRIMLLNRPWVSLCAQVGRHGIFLPHPDYPGAAGPYESLSSRAGQSHSDTFSGALYRWPKYPIYARNRSDKNT